MPRVLEIGIQTAISRRLCNRSYDEVDQILARQRSSFERAAVGSWIAVGAAEEVLQHSAGVLLMFLGAA
jgi:hypothetical protein